MTDKSCRHGYLECATCESDLEHEIWVLEQWPFALSAFKHPIVRAISAKITEDGQLAMTARLFIHRRWLKVPGDWWRSHTEAAAVAAQMMWYRLIRDTIADVLEDVGAVLEHAVEMNSIPAEMDALRIQLSRCRLDPSCVTTSNGLIDL